MYRGKTITVCLPCRNEAKNLKATVKRIPKFVDEIIVISNLSTDNTVAQAKKLGLKVVEDNRTKGGIGYGFAHMTGIKQATSDIIVGADGDATYPLEILDKVIDHLIDNDLDFVSCNRYPLQKGTKVSMPLRLGVWTLNKEVRFLYGLKINDILSGMWVFYRPIADKLNLSMGDWNICPQIKLNAAFHPDIEFGEYSIPQHRREGQSHQQYLRTGLSHMFWILKNRFIDRPLKPPASPES
jgi:glycosyltransferase involved in cell wall biosynthesis